MCALRKSGVAPVRCKGTCPLHRIPSLPVIRLILRDGPVDALYSI